jgi:serine/threonine-protein phosphatase 6 regulatory ankyrin repeat subunit B
MLLAGVSFGFASAPDRTSDQELITACANGDAAAVQRLIAEGANVNAKDKASGGGTGVVEEDSSLTKSGDINSVKQGGLPERREGWTPIIWAAANGHADVVRILLASKADKNSKDRGGVSALIWSVYSGRQVITAWSQTIGAGGVQIKQAGYQFPKGACDPDCVKALLEAGADVNYQARGDGTSALIEAAKQDSLACVKLLVAAGANVNAKARGGSTALSSCRSEEIKAFLRDSGAKS